MSNLPWIKQKEREAFDELISYLKRSILVEDSEQLLKLLATYRKRAFDAGVFEGENKNSGV